MSDYTQGEKGSIQTKDEVLVKKEAFMKDEIKKLIDKADELYFEEKFYEAFNIYAPLADNGNPHAMYRLGRMYCAGYGPETDFKKDFNLIQKAAKLGDEKAIDICSEPKEVSSGEDIPMKHESEKLIDKADELHFNKNYKEAFEIYTSLADNGNTHAMYRLGKMYCAGYGTKVNCKKGLKLIRRAQGRKYGIMDMFYIALMKFSNVL